MPGRARAGHRWSRGGTAGTAAGRPSGSSAQRPGAPWTAECGGRGHHRPFRMDRSRAVALGLEFAFPLFFFSCGGSCNFETILLVRDPLTIHGPSLVVGPV